MVHLPRISCLALLFTAGFTPLAPALDAAPSTAEVTGGAEARQRYFDERAKLMQADETFLELANSRGRLRLQRDYQPLVQSFNFTQEEQEYFYAALQYYDYRNREVIRQHHQSDADDQDIVAQAQALSDERHKVFRSFLNHEGDFQTLLGYERSLTYRKELQDYGTCLAPANALTPEQFEGLVTVLHRENAFHRPHPLVGGVENHTQKEIDTQLETLREFDATVVEAARDVLTPAQLEVFRAYRTMQTNDDFAGFLLGRRSTLLKPLTIPAK
ncbi:MAG: hypothetical protein Q7P63_11335 [Verrucomicrobiota bacterium JB022]|nr:hypothetical protein [Verrucomicrobiota bacterium JB022]